MSQEEVSGLIKNFQTPPFFTFTQLLHLSNWSLIISPDSLIYLPSQTIVLFHSNPPIFYFLLSLSVLCRSHPTEKLSLLPAYFSLLYILIFSNSSSNFKPILIFFSLFLYICLTLLINISLLFWFGCVNFQETWRRQPIRPKQPPWGGFLW